MTTKTSHMELTIQNELGLHARAATLFVNTAMKFNAEVIVEKGGREVNGKSILGLLMLLAPKGSKIRLVSTGEDCDEQLAELKALIDNKFGEGR
jgi:phosphocarrier protein HPr